MDAVVADFDGDLSVREVGPVEGRLDFNLGLFLGVRHVPEGHVQLTKSSSNIYAVI